MSDKLKTAFIKYIVTENACRTSTLHDMRVFLLTTKNHPVLRSEEGNVVAIRMDHWPESWGKVNTTWVLRGETPPSGGPYHYDKLFGTNGKLPDEFEYPVTIGECRGFYNQENPLFITAEYVLVPEQFVLDRIKR